MIRRCPECGIGKAAIAVRQEPDGRLYRVCANCYAVHYRRWGVDTGPELP